MPGFGTYCRGCGKDICTCDAEMKRDNYIVVVIVVCCVAFAALAQILSR